MTVLSLVFAIIQIGYGFPSMPLSRSRGVDVMTHKFPTKPDLTHTDRYDRFVATTQQIGALANLKNFERHSRRHSKAHSRTSTARDDCFDIERTVPAGAATPRATELNNRGYSWRELRRRLSAEQSTPRFEPCLPSCRQSPEPCSARSIRSR